MRKLALNDEILLKIEKPSLVTPTPSGCANDMIICGLYPVVNAIGISARRIAFWK